MKKKIDMTLYLVSDSTGLCEEDFLKKIEDACKGGITLLQFREKQKTTMDFYQLAKKVKQITERYHIPLIIDDRVDIALAMDADGVHVGGDDLPVQEAIRLLGANKIVGATCKTVEAAVRAQRDGADYVGVGAIFPTTTKVKTVRTSVETLQEICQNITIPVGAIGGLNKDNCDILKGSGCNGICVVSAIMKQADCCRAASELKEKIVDLIA